MLALMLESPETAQELVKEALKEGVLLFFLLFEPKAVRISPPLTITEKQIKQGCQVIMHVLDKLNC